MKALFKLKVLASTVLFCSAMTVHADDTTFKSKEDRAAYALGTSLEMNMSQYFDQQKDLGFILNKEQFVAGVQDSAANKSKLTKEEAEEAIKSLQQQLETKAAEKAEKDAKEAAEKGDAYRAEFSKKPRVVKTNSGLLYKVEKAGKGEVVKENDTVVVNYRGTLTDGTEFDSSYKGNTPVTFPLDSVIPGWTEGLQLIKKGGKITLVIPPELAYGDRAIGNIPANSTLIFEVELLDVNPKVDAPAKK